MKIQVAMLKHLGNGSYAMFDVNLDADVIIGVNPVTKRAWIVADHTGLVELVKPENMKKLTADLDAMPTAAHPHAG
jgi:hypothetical protein